MKAIISDDSPLTLKIRQSKKFLRLTVFSITLLFVHALIAPDVFAIQENMHEGSEARKIVLSGSPEQKMNQALVKVQEIANEAQKTISQRLAEESGLLDSILSFLGLSQLQLENIDQLKELEKLIAGQHLDTLQKFDLTEDRLNGEAFSPEVSERHSNMVDEYISNYEEMMARIGNALNAKNLGGQSEAIDSLHDMMSTQKLKKTHQLVDPNNLPWGSPDATKTRKPGKTPEALSQLTSIPNHPQATMLAANIITPEMLGKFGGPVAEDLIETTDIKLTEAIRLKSLELNEDPVEIYNWVRNNIEFIPTYGSIQGADYTLEYGKGNAFDTASLLIALLRAANIPARYAYGTIEIPAEKAMNWVGDVDVPSAAQQLLGQGGIPNLGIISGGKIKSIQLEHIWVEAWVDYFPSRAAKHIVGDQWIPLDASFKQYNYVEGIGFGSEAGPDIDELVSSVISNTTQDDIAGSIEGVPTQDIDAFITQYTDELAGYIDSQGGELTVQQVLGAKRTIIFEPMSLASGLPYSLIARTENFSKIPDTLRHKIRFTLQSESSGGFGGYSSFSDILSSDFSLPELAGKTMSLSYKPATDLDNETLIGLIPEAGALEGDIPRSIPGYLINVSAELNIDKNTVLTRGSVPLGTETNHKMEIYAPSTGWASTNATGVAGEYRAIGIDSGGISPKQLTDIQEESEELLEKIAVDDLTGLTKHHLSGLMMQTNILSYFAMNNIMSDFQSRAAGVVEFRLPSYGYFMTSLTPSYYFGRPVSVETSGVTMDVPYLRTMSTAKDNDREKWVQFNRSSGLRASFLENWIPEFMLSTEDQPLDGVSAAKLLILAQEQGQKVYTLTSANSNQLSNVQIDSAARQDILNSLRAGKEVTVHDSPINVNGWSGSGYLVIDPETGAGGYLISGGANGGSISDILMGFSGWLLGMIDGAFGHLAGSAWFSSSLKYTQRMLALSTRVGYFGLILGVGSVFYNEGLTWDAVGAASVAILAFALTAVAVAALAVVTGAIAGAILGGFAAAGIGYLGVLITRRLF